MSIAEKPLLTFFGDANLKAQLVARAKAHQEADEYRQGFYYLGREQKGCLIGFSLVDIARIKGVEIRPNDHAAFSEHAGIPEWLAHLADKIFEGLAKAEATAFPLQFWEAIPVGANVGSAESAAESVPESVAWAAAWSAQKNRLLELLAAAPVVDVAA